MNIKKIFFAFITCSSIYSMSEKPESLIALIENLSIKPAIVTDSISIEKIDPLDSRSLNKNGMLIPFCSIKHYMKQFIKNIPFVPDNTLQVKTVHGLFHLWQNESGIICAPDPKATDDWKMRVLLSLKKDDPLIKLLLIINKLGLPNVSKLKTVSAP